MSSFGDWYEKQNREAGNDESALGSDMLPLFLQNGSIPSDLGWDNFKSNLEAQMPQQILGMNYQQRFKVQCMSDPFVGRKKGEKRLKLIINISFSCTLLKFCNRYSVL